jgi:hypothetical protein
LDFKCYCKPNLVTKKSGKWTAICVNLSLTASGNTFLEAKKNLKFMIDSYIRINAIIHDLLIKRKGTQTNRLLWYLGKIYLFPIFSYKEQNVIKGNY